MEIESHPFEPFLPSGARVLFLGTFPAKSFRWSMNFYYPNYLNDFWRVMGLIFFEDAGRFEIKAEKRWDEVAIRAFCASVGLAFSDTAEQIRRLKGNASDAALEIVKTRDIAGLLSHLPECRAVATTGGLASEVLAGQFGAGIPPVGASRLITIAGRGLSFYRLPSTSRAYPLAIAKKAGAYGKMMKEVGF